MKCYRLLWFVLLLFEGHIAFSMNTLKLNGSGDQDVIEYLSEFADCSKNLSVKEILPIYKRHDFVQTPASRVINRGVTPCNYWFVVTIENTTASFHDYLWSFYNDGIQFTLYELDASAEQIVNQQTVAHRNSLMQRLVPLRTLSFQIPLGPHEAKTFLLKTELRGRQNLYFPTRIGVENEMLMSEIQFSFLLGRYYGFFIFATLFNLFLYLILKKRFYGVMVGYIASLLAFNLMEYLHDVYFLPPEIYVFWSKIPKLVFLGFILFFNVKVFQHFTLHRQFLPVANRYLGILNRVLLIATLIFLILHNLAPNNPGYLHSVQVAFVSVLLAQTLLLVINIALAVWKRTKYILHYLLGNSLFIVSLILYTINALNLGDIPVLVAPGNTIFAFSFEIVYLMIAFTVKYKRDFDHFTSEIAQGEKKRARLTAELIMVQENERQRIGQDVHDGIGGTLHSLRLLLENEGLKEQTAIHEILGDINHEFRRLIHQVSPKKLEDSGLFGCIEYDLKRYECTAMEITCEFLGDESTIPADMKMNVFRIYQELLNNAVKHAKTATSIFVSLSVDNDQLRLMVEDNGTGFDGRTKSEGGMGMGNIRSRVDFYGGEFHLDSSANGLVAIIHLPLLKKQISTYD